MGHNKIKWNISIEQGNEIAHSILKDILYQNKDPIPLDELIFLLNSRAKKYKIHNNRKHNCFTKYLKIVHGGIINFLDNYTMYGIIHKSDKKFVVLISENILSDTSPLKSITRDSDWIFL
tara:strand:- start:196 stop:555 length:360 start_codon:yes stop_codon:yes gene_type:complete